MNLKILSNLNSQLNSEGQRLLGDFIRKCEGAECTDVEALEMVESMFKGLKHQYPAPPIRFINFKDFSSLGRLPRYPDNADITCTLDIINRSSSLLVFISHCWLRGHSGSEGWDGKAHPDNGKCDKYKLCVEGIRRLKNNIAPRKRCYIWIDFGCMNQDDKEKMSEELERYDKIIQCCDCMFTPIVDPDYDNWELPMPYSNLFKDYKASSWSCGPQAYLNRAWCRMEMMYALAMPRLEDGERYTEKRPVLIDPDIFYQRRPHFLYGSRERFNSLEPIQLPSLRLYFHDYHPVKGSLSVASDIESIRLMLSQLQPFIEKCRVSVNFQEENSAFVTYHSNNKVVEVQRSCDESCFGPCAACTSDWKGLLTVEKECNLNTLLDKNHKVFIDKAIHRTDGVILYEDFFSGIQVDL